jgi:hypothetical protein
VTAQALTYGPFRLLAMRVGLLRQFTVHLVETLNGVRCAIGHFEIVAEGAINRESCRCKLQTNGISSQRGPPKQNAILTLRAETKASLHELFVNFNFAHSRKSCVGDGERRVVSILFSGVERHRCKKSVAKCRMHGEGMVT